MKNSDKKVVVAILRMSPLIFAAVTLQGLGAVVLIFFVSAAFPEQRWPSQAVALPYLCWSSWRVQKYITKL